MEDKTSIRRNYIQAGVSRHTQTLPLKKKLTNPRCSNGRATSFCPSSLFRGTTVFSDFSSSFPPFLFLAVFPDCDDSGIPDESESSAWIPFFPLNSGQSNHQNPASLLSISDFLLIRSPRLVTERAPVFRWPIKTT